MSRLVKRIIVIVVILAAIISIIVYKVLDARIYYNDTDVNGNTIGNLYGNGLFCEMNGLVYFANPNDGNSLYSMKPDESDVTKICNDRVYFINADEHYIYYSRDNNNDESQMSFLNVNTHSLCRINTNGKKLTILDDEVCSTLSLNKNTLYYHRYDKGKGTTLYTVGIDGEDKGQLFTNSVDPRCLVKNQLYYSGVENDHYIHKYNVSNGANSQVSSEWTWMPTVVGDLVYYMDLEDNNRIACSSLADGTKTMITSYGSSDYNVAGNYLYYQSIKAEKDGIYRVNLMTGEEILILGGQFHSINATSKFVYFIDYFNGTCFHLANNSTHATVFTPAIELD